MLSVVQHIKRGFKIDYLCALFVGDGVKSQLRCMMHHSTTSKGIQEKAEEFNRTNAYITDDET
jgi:hypothetical protein